MSPPFPSSTPTDAADASAPGGTPRSLRGLLLRRRRWLRPILGASPSSAGRWFKRLAGILLVIGGLFGFLPLVGFWMFPLGLIVLTQDIPAARRLRRRMMRALAARRGSVRSGG